MVMHPEEIKKIWAVSAEEATESGCPHCGIDLGIFDKARRSGSIFGMCQACQGDYAVLYGNNHDGMTINGVSPQLTDHPRKGVKKHSRPAF